MEKLKKGYYNIEDDFELYPHAWLYVVLSARGPGKTYGVLKYMVEHDEKFCFMKRTKKDVNMLVKYEDFNPFKPINRDTGRCIEPYKFDDGIGVFKEDDEVKGYSFSLGGISDIKGFDLSELDYMIFDEYIPMKGSRVSRSEGLNLLDAYETIKRDRKKRGRNELKLVLFGNPVNISCPVNNTLYLVDYLEEMQVKGKEYLYLEDARVMIHILDKDKYYMSENEEEEGINILMKGSSWYSTNKEGKFAYNDFDKISKKSLKGFRPLFKVHKDRDTIVVYTKNGTFYVCDSGTNRDVPIIDLDIETDQHVFYENVYNQFRGYTVDGRVRFQKYSYYDLFFHFKEYFSLT